MFVVTTRHQLLVSYIYDKFSNMIFFLQSVEMHYSVTVIRQTRVRWAGHLVRIGQLRNN
jgi:hypothetical protein